MTSLRHKSPLDRSLEAARESLLEVGWKRTTLTDVARRAGVSRMTIYRIWPDMESLLGDLMSREWDVMLTGLAAPTHEPTHEPAHGPTQEPAAQDQPAPRRIADGVVAAVRALRTNELFRRVLDLDPELLLPYLLQRRGRSQSAILALLADQIRLGQESAEVREGSPELLARTVLLAAHGAALSAPTMTGDGIGLEELDAGLGLLLERGLAR